ncbi:hypothetical protein lerEdw1_007608 [Lerista edwardsae]|nr:hypothetical protein lerEdw1_007608 [Lerista edwardsae]
MSRVPLGKVLLRNVIRHTDAHNKIQEESEMWKIRELEKQTEDGYRSKQRKMLPNSSSSRMRSDGFDEESQSADLRARNLAPMSVTTEEDLHHTRYWNKKLYEYEANMPDRWGHSGYKELYPEEFDTDSDQQDEQNSVNGKRKSPPGKRPSLELPKRKKAKKSHKKKRKKKSHKKQKKKKQEPQSAASESPEESECSAEVASGGGKRKRKRRKKTKKPSVKPPASGPNSGSSQAGSCTSSSSVDSEPEQKREKQPKKKRRKRHVLVLEKYSDGAQEKRSKRKNWKVAADENSEDSSEED